MTFDVFLVSSCDEAMQDGFADLFREVPPDDLLGNNFSDDMFDMEDYLNELLPENVDTGRLTASKST